MRSPISGYNRLTKVHKFSAAGIAAAGVAALAFAVVPGGSADAGTQSIAVKPVAWTSTSLGVQEQQDQLGKQSDNAAKLAKRDAEAKKKADAEAKAKADKERAEKQAASRSEERKPVQAAPAPAPAPKTYANNLDGWIREAMDIMKAKGIPGSYDGIKRNIMRESTGNPNAINNWDSNAAAGIPSKGLLQVIDPTFKAYHVEGTSWNIYDPVANITAACNYAWKVYGSMDNVNSAY
ncbi:transglycosylase SLT domain-containing protein [Streptomyces sp. ISL-11]|uniref:transglycosylase SLT domain-containing protein n=1 Tax=Streptomyces sp. ISL-11 TaxID=2819174 RepID=UPI001BE9A0AB|nr:transglycosylase SLT domain-containing protein [Streptomyces sp. ISL-11]MBT2385174.1 transglycosylase SLT domain-containing protein [Streptomyces sp. ISL-11]